MISVGFQGKPFNITVIQACAPTSNAKEAEVEWFQEDLQDLLEVTPKKLSFFITGDENAKVGSQEISGITGNFDFGIEDEAGTDAQAEAPILWPPDGKTDPLEKTLMLGRLEGRRRRGRDGWMASPTRWI